MNKSMTPIENTLIHEIEVEYGLNDNKRIFPLRRILKCLFKGVNNLAIQFEEINRSLCRLGVIKIYTGRVGEGQDTIYYEFRGDDYFGPGMKIVESENSRVEPIALLR